VLPQKHETGLFRRNAKLQFGILLCNEKGNTVKQVVENSKRKKGVGKGQGKEAGQSGKVSGGAEGEAGTAANGS
jgi:hypothetical protein